MKNIGIICEYNPFHNGHAYQLEAVRQAGRAVCLMSGNFVQRGEPAVIDKYTRAKAAVLCGADLVLELPLTYAVASAEGFADGAVEVFSSLGIMDGLCFGSESGSMEELLRCAEILLSEELEKPLKEGLQTGLSFPKARQLAAESLGAAPGLLALPNNILALEYCKALLKRRSSILPMVLKRRGAYHGGQEKDAPSASFLRSVENWAEYVPEEAWKVFSAAPRYTVEAGERAWLSRLRFMEEGDFEALPYGSEGLWRKVMEAGRTGSSLEEIIERARSKRYPRTRLQRMLLCAYLGITEELLHESVPYIRVLAMNARGQELMRIIRKNSTLPILHPGDEAPRCAYSALERRAEDLYGLFCTEKTAQAGYLQKARLFRHTEP
ncbi:MAG: nucleotidyltransferase family protein [Oscillospiraceae bacterium]|nr:nucleotidyltransferase family protein [Oscillospiraceae bacterium]